MKLSLFVIVAFTISSCSANDETFCQHYDENLKWLQIFCDRRELPQNCTHDIPSLDPLNVIRLKIERCDETLLANVSEKYQNIERLDISYSQYRSLNWTGGAFKNVIDLNASFNELTTIPASILSKFPKLTSLELSNNQLTKISAGDFENVPKLSAINLSHNKLGSIDANAFVKLTDLKKLNLRNNYFTSLPALNELTATEIDFDENSLLSTFNCTLISAIRSPSSWLYLTWNYITTFRGDQDCGKQKIYDFKIADRDGIHISSAGLQLTLSNPNFQNIQTFVAGEQSLLHIDVHKIFQLLGASVLKIDLTGNNVNELHATAFERFPGLRELILRDTALKTFDVDVLNPNNQDYLNRLDISANDLEYVKNADRLKSLQQLTHFNAAGNKIQNAHEILRRLPQRIQRLNLAGNHLGNVLASNVFGHFEALEYLNLSNTQLSIIDSNPSSANVSLHHLIRLDVSHNNLSYINLATVLNASHQLREIYAAHCQIKNVPEIIENLKPSVEILDLSGNSIESMIDYAAIHLNNNLTHLNLSATNLHKFDLESIEALQSLQTLDISYNHLKSIKLNAMTNFTHLKRLYLNGNDLTELDFNALAESPYVHIAIAKNHLSCMYLKELRHYLPYLTYIGNQLDQKHGEDCLSSTQAIGDFLNSVYDKVKFW